MNLRFIGGKILGESFSQWILVLQFFSDQFDFCTLAIKLPYILREQCQIGHKGTISIVANGDRKQTP